MAFISEFERDDKEVKSLHPTYVVCNYMAREFDGKKVLQLNTYGSNDREKPGKLSQTLQLDEAGAISLLKILKSEFGI